MNQLDFFHAARSTPPPPAPVPTLAPLAYDPHASPFLERLRSVEGWTCDPVPPSDKHKAPALHNATPYDANGNAYDIGARAECEVWIFAGVMVSPWGKPAMLEAMMQRPPIQEGQRALVARLSRMEAGGGAAWLLTFGAVAAVRAAIMGRSGWGVQPLASWSWGGVERGSEDARAAAGVSRLVMERGDVEAALVMGRGLAGRVRALTV